MKTLKTPSHYLVHSLDKEAEKVDCILVDEAQFLEPSQIEQLFFIAMMKNTAILAYGIRSDFQTNAFLGSARLFELAHSIEEMKTICRCGAKAMFNGRKFNGEFVSEGEQVSIDGQQAEYESLCGKCYIELVGWNY